MNRILLLVLGISLTQWLVPSELFAQCCSHCGRTCTTRQVCRTIYTTKSVAYTQWGEECEEIGLAPKTQGADCGTCESCDSAQVADCSSFGCDSAGATEKSGGLTGLTSWFRQLSSCETRPRARLMRKTLVRQVPVVECVIEDVCEICQQSELSTSGILAATSLQPNSFSGTPALVNESNVMFSQAAPAGPAFYQQVNESRPFAQMVSSEMPPEPTTDASPSKLNTPFSSHLEAPYNYLPLTRQPTEVWVR